MKNLELYEGWFSKKQLTEEDIKQFIIDNNHTLNDFGGVNTDPIKYKINNGVKSSLLSVDVDGGIYILGYKKSKLPFKFGKIRDGFIFRGGIKKSNQVMPIHKYIETLENFPDYVGEYFEFTYTKVKTFKNGPRYVGGTLDCQNNDIRDFYGFPESFRGKLIIHHNPVFDILYKLIPSNINHEANEQQIRFIELLNDYTVIRNGDTIVKDRLEEALYGVGLKKERDLRMLKNYKII